MGLLPYAYQDSYIITDIGTTWASANDKYSATAYMQNLFDKECKNAISLNGGQVGVGVSGAIPVSLG